MNLRARLSERVHIEDIREVLHFIQDDERLREEVYQLIFDKDAYRFLSGIVGMYSFLKGRCSMVEPETRRIDRRCHDLPTLGKTENDPEPDMPATCRRSATSGFP